MKIGQCATPTLPMVISLASMATLTFASVNLVSVVPIAVVLLDVVQQVINANPMVSVWMVVACVILVGLVPRVKQMSAQEIVPTMGRVLLYNPITPRVGQAAQNDAVCVNLVGKELGARNWMNVARPPSVVPAVATDLVKTMKPLPLHFVNVRRRIGSVLFARNICRTNAPLMFGTVSSCLSF